MTAPRAASKTLRIVEEHCAHFRELFCEVRTFENFQWLHVGLLSELPRKSFPAMARWLGLRDGQALHHLVTTEHLQTSELAHQRQALAREALAGRKVTLIVDETGDRKKGNTTDYVARQYLGSLGKVDNGLVTVHLLALVGEITIPLCWRVFKPKDCLRPGESHRSKVALAREMLDEIATWGLDIDLVTGDSLYGMASEFVAAVRKHQWDYAMALRSDFGKYLPEGQEIWTKDWVTVSRNFCDGTSEQRWAQEVIWGTQSAERYVVLTSDTENQPKAETSFVRFMLSGDNSLQRLPDLYGRRTWVEAAFRNQKTELGWHHWRLTRWEHIERWYEIVLSTYTMISLEALRRENSEHNKSEGLGTSVQEQAGVSQAPNWRGGHRWIDALRDAQSWVKPIGAVAVLLSWSSTLALEQAPLLSALKHLFTLPFS